VLWMIVWTTLFRPSPVPFHAWRRLLLRLFGANIGPRAVPYPSARIWAPWNLVMGPGSCLSHFVDCYCVELVILEEDATVSQYAHLCTASHDYRYRDMPLIAGPIRICKGAWVTACAFIGPGVEVGEGAIVGACSAVFRDVPAWTIVGGNPAKYIKPRAVPR
jgi:putative colanic acid biosynthesis acetyltransferase WcaF